MSIDLKHRPAPASDDTIALAPAQAGTAGSVAPPLPDDWQWARCARHGDVLHRRADTPTGPVWECCTCERAATELPRRTRRAAA